MKNKQSRVTTLLCLVSVLLLLLFITSCKDEESGADTTAKLTSAEATVATTAPITTAAPVTTRGEYYEDPSPKNRYILFPTEGVDRVNIEYKRHDIETLKGILSEKYESFNKDVDCVAPILYTRADKSEYEIFYAYIHSKTFVVGAYTVYVKDGSIVAIWESRPDPLLIAPGSDGAAVELDGGYTGDVKEMLERAVFRAADLLSEANAHLGRYEGGIQSTEDKNGYRHYYYGVWAGERRGDTLHCYEYEYMKKPLE